MDKKAEAKTTDNCSSSSTASSQTVGVSTRRSAQATTPVEEPQAITGHKGVTTTQHLRLEIAKAQEVKYTKQQASLVALATYITTTLGPDAYDIYSLAEPVDLSIQGRLKKIAATMRTTNEQTRERLRVELNAYIMNPPAKRSADEKVQDLVRI